MKKVSQEIDVFIKARIYDIGARLKLREDEQALYCVSLCVFLIVHIYEFNLL
jgi:hypothetical protein